MPASSLYETDFYGWTQEQARLIRSGTISALDMENILEEIEAMGRSERRNFHRRARGRWHRSWTMVFGPNLRKIDARSRISAW